jgi:hypothetical protein
MDSYKTKSDIGGKDLAKTVLSLLDDKTIEKYKAMYASVDTDGR